MNVARVTFGSDSNRAHFVIDLSEQATTKARNVTVEEDGSVTFVVFDGETEDFKDLADRYSGHIMWLEGE